MVGCLELRSIPAGPVTSQVKADATDKVKLTVYWSKCGWQNRKVEQSKAIVAVCVIKGRRTERKLDSEVSECCVADAA